MSMKTKALIFTKGNDESVRRQEELCYGYTERIDADVITSAH